MARQRHITLMLVGILLFVSLTYFMSSGRDSGPMRPHGSWTGMEQAGQESSSASGLGIPDRILQGGSIAPKLENATAKAELGRASWRLFHTMMARFPEEPSADDRLALETYIRLFARLYPCGDCASHFQKLLGKYPPQTNNRNAAAGWACFVHNQVNKRLKKEEFDCSKLGDFYDCGCGDEDGKAKKAPAEETGELKERTFVDQEVEEREG